MANLKVTSKKYNDKDVLEVNDQDFAEAVQKAPVFEVSNIKALTAEQLDSLKCGDIVAKKTGNQKHAYVVSYKGEGAGEGICLTYTDASTVETVSYDRSGSSWVYNSTDITPLGGSGGTKLYKHRVEVNTENNYYYFDIISNNSLSLSSGGDIGIPNDVLSITDTTDVIISLGWLFFFVGSPISGGNAIGQDMTYTEENVTSITDTITEL